jgi:hypothetical protein
VLPTPFHCIDPAKLIHEAEWNVVDLVLRDWIGRCSSWRRFDFLRQAAALSAAAILYIWQWSITGGQTIILSLGLPLRHVRCCIAFVFVIVETMTTRPNQALYPTAASHRCCNRRFS